MEKPVPPLIRHITFLDAGWCVDRLGPGKKAPGGKAPMYHKALPQEYLLLGQPGGRQLQGAPCVLQLVGHHADDLFVGGSHPLTAQTAHISDGGLHPFDNDAVPSVELLAVAEHHPAEERCV